MSKLVKVKSNEKIQQTLTNTESYSKKGIHISLKYLHKCNVYCLKELHKYSKRKHNDNVFDELQKFIYEAEKCDNLDEMIGSYTSSKGSKIDNSNHFVKQVIKKFKEAYPEDAGLVSSKLIHIHTKRKGKGSFVIFGQTYENTFYILAFDPEHSFDKI